MALDTLVLLMNNDSADTIADNLKDCIVNPEKICRIQCFFDNEHNKGSICMQFSPREGRPRGLRPTNANAGAAPMPDVRSFREKKNMDLWHDGPWEIDVAFGANKSSVLCCCIEKRTRYSIIILLKNKERIPLCTAVAQNSKNFTVRPLLLIEVPSSSIIESSLS